MTNGRIADVVVVGAGPGGCAAAITLARAGRAVLVIDKARFPRDKCCGDGLTTGCLSRLGALGLDRASVPSWTPIETVTICSPSGRIAELPLQQGPMGAAAVAPRIELDAALCALARSNGAEILQGATCVGLKQRGDGVIVELQDGQFVRGDFIIAADGARSIVQRSIPQRDAELSLLPFRDFQHRSDHKRDTSSLASEWYAYRGYVTEISSYAATHMCVWFDESLLPGYGWSFPMVGGVANIGCCVRRRAGDPGYLLADAWRATLAHPFLATLTTNAASHVERVRAWPIPSRIGTARLSAWEGRVLFVGDAARAADPMSGEGVGQALETGIAAAHAIAAYHPSNHAVVARVYEHYLSRTLGRDHVMAQLLSNVLSHPLGARAAVRVSGISERSARLVGRWLFEDFPRSIVISPSQWHHRSKIPLATRARVNP